jgi:hypothetical protein
LNLKLYNIGLVPLIMLERCYKSSQMCHVHKLQGTYA